MRLLIFSSRFPFPLDKGDKLRIFHQIKNLSLYHEIYLVSIIDEDIHHKYIKEVEPYVKRIFLIRITPVERIISLLRSLFSGLPLQVGFFYSKKIHQELNTIFYQVKPDHCYCQLIRMAEYVKDMPVSKTLDYMDGFGVSMDRRSKIARFPLNYFYRLEAKFMMAYENNIAEHFDNLIIISEQDKALFEPNTAERMQVVGNGISDYFFDYQNHSISKEYELVFIGNMSYLPNIETAKYLVKEIMPQLPEHFKLLIAGTNPTNQVKSWASARVIISGRVDDIRAYYLKGKIFIVPMWSGTGQQNKILEALALGIPCITTNEVNNAIGAKAGKEILIAQSKDEFILAVHKLLDDSELYKQIVVNGKQFVKENYDWKQKALILSSIFARKSKFENGN